MKTNYQIFTFILLLAVLITGCAETTTITNCVMTPPCGFLSGLWHGSILPISFLVSLFSDHIAIYAVNNNGGWYDFGFVLSSTSFGVAILQFFVSILNSILNK